MLFYHQYSCNVINDTFFKIFQLFSIYTKRMDQSKKNLTTKFIILPTRLTNLTKVCFIPTGIPTELVVECFPSFLLWNVFLQGMFKWVSYSSYSGLCSQKVCWGRVPKILVGLAYNSKSCILMWRSDSKTRGRGNIQYSTPISRLTKISFDLQESVYKENILPPGVQILSTPQPSLSRSSSQP